MNNLLKSLSTRRLKLCASDTDVRRLLSTVKEGRTHDSKLSDAFYDSLEGILLDLRAVTIDNRDAEAFLRPVSKTDYPDYYDIISNPMDLQTMLKKVKQKQYKSKREFADDLELIWSNCYMYNTGDQHPLRLCAKRLRMKADRLLKNVTDRRDRVDPPVPATLSASVAQPKLNGVVVNGHSRQHSSPPITKARSPSIVRRETPAPPKQPPREVLFPDMPAFVRTASGMSTFMELDAQLDGPSTSSLPQRLTERLKSIAGLEPESEEEMEAVNGDIGDKRKMLLNGDYRPRKRARMHSYDRKLDGGQDPVEVWWEATRSCALMTNAVPTLTYSTSQISNVPLHPPPSRPTVKKKGKRRKKKEDQLEQPPTTLLGLMNENIRVMKRVRRTHNKFLTVKLNSEEGGAAGAAGGSVEPPEPVVAEEEVDVHVDETPWRPRGSGLEMGEQEADGCLQWMGGKVLEHAGFQSTSQTALDVFTGVTADYLMNIGRTIRFLCDKYSQTMSAEEIILHTLFESGITHIRDLERYIKDDVVRYGGRLIDLEKKLVGAYREVTAVEAIDDDALFGNEDDEEEDSEFVMGNFTDAFGEDFLGLRELGIAGEHGLSSLTVPKKLLKGKDKRLGAVPDGAKPVEPPLPYPIPSPFIPLDLSKLDDQIGLLKPFYMQKLQAISTSSAQLPVPLPPGQLQPHPPLPRPPSSIQLPAEFQLSASTIPVLQTSAPLLPTHSHAPSLILLDDPPNPTRTKIGPLGQIVKTGLSSAAAKKKAKAKENLPTVSGGNIKGAEGEQLPSAGPVSTTDVLGPGLGSGAAGSGETPKKKKSGGGGGGKKKDKAKSETLPVPPVIVAA